MKHGFPPVWIGKDKHGVWVSKFTKYFLKREHHPEECFRCEASPPIPSSRQPVLTIAGYEKETLMRHYNIKSISHFFSNLESSVQDNIDSRILTTIGQ
ncbi:MAG: hypothetical protein CL912_27300 [Deltaproteobacteria bacterium]|nr:hypothetical protein [Deltaproteobacteria bacterium]